MTPEERKKLRNAAVRRYEKRNPDKKKAWARKTYLNRSAEERQKQADQNLNAARAMRQMLLKAMGGKCVRCGFDDWRALQADHIHGGGGKERAVVTNRNAYYKTILANPDKYQLLCANCNWIKRYEKEEYRWNVIPRLTTASTITED